MDSWELLSQENIEFLAPLLKAGLTKADIVALARTFTEADPPTAAPSAVSSHSRSRATVAHQSHVSQVMIHLVKTVKDPKKAFIVEFLHMVDTGGQPEFIEIMPSLIHNSNFTLLVLNLAQSLDEYPPIHFHEDGTAFR